MTVLESAAGAARARIIAADMREERGIELLLGHVLERAACRLGGSRFLDRLLLGGLFGGLHVDLNLHEHARIWSSSCSNMLKASRLYSCLGCF